MNTTTENPTHATLTVFQFKDDSVRVITINAEPWFVAADVCRALGLEQVTRACDRLDPDDLTQNKVIDTLGREQVVNCISEAGLYDLTLRSDKPEARVFKRWITHEVLPAIRKTGHYATNGIPSSIEAKLAMALSAIESITVHLAKLMEDKQPAPKVRELRPAETEHRITVAEFLDIRGFGFQQMKAFGNSVKSFANAIGTVYTTKPCRWYGESRSYPRDLLNTLWREWSQHGGRKFRK